MKIRFHLITSMILSFTAFAFTASPPKNTPTGYDQKWGSEISAFKQWDAKNSHPDNAILFVGSSSIRLWKTASSFPQSKVINRGFGGSDIKAVNHFFDQIVSCYHPAKIVFYAGDNDIAQGLAPDAVCQDFKTFCRLCSRKLPDTEIIFISIKYCGRRIDLMPQMKKANALIAAFCQTRPRIQFIDLASCLLKPNGIPDDTLFRQDRLHLNEAGYRLWTHRLQPLLVPPQPSPQPKP